MSNFVPVEANLAEESSLLDESEAA